MSYLAAVELKKAITAHTGLMARVSVKKGEYRAVPILPSSVTQLSKIQRATLYALHKNAGGADNSCSLATLMSCMGFKSCADAMRVIDHLEAHDWLNQIERNRFALSAQSLLFINSVCCL